MAWVGLGLLLTAGIALAAVWYWRGTGTGSAAPTLNESVPVGSSTMEEMDLAIAANQIATYKQAALRGDNEAAARLAGHYAQSRRRAEEIRWLTLAANRGHCASMSWLRTHAEDDGDRRTAARWNDSMRRHVCTWGKTHPLVSDPRYDSTPLWNEH